MTERLRYLSDRWLDEADRRLASLTPLPASVSVGMAVLGGPDGDRLYRLVLGPDRVGVALGLADSGVHMTLAWEVAVDIAQGRASAQRAFLDGRMQLGGDTSLLLGYQQQLADIEDRLDRLRADTDFG
ncbi:MAG: hypothetical protein ACR2QK_04525 [Acidimicrobiales bacterium]